MENLVWLGKLGITDQLLLEANPKLVIVHVSGFGTPAFGGVSEVCDRASYDIIGQAYSGFMSLNGEPEPRPPVVSGPWLNDYITALHAVFAALTGYVNAQRTGKGQSVDVSQYESSARLLSDTFVAYLAKGAMKKRTGSKAVAFQPYGLFKSKDDSYVAIGAFGPGVYNRFLQAIGLDPEYYTFKECAASPAAVASEKGRELDRKTIEWVAGRTADEAVDAIAKFKVGCSKVYQAADAVKDPHWIDRGNFIDYEDQTIGKNIKAFGVVPKFDRTPGQVWRGAPQIGQDTDSILSELLGYDADKINSLREKKLI